MIKSIGVHIKVADFVKSVKFYKALGFVEVFGYGPNREVKEDYNGVVFEAGGSKIEIADGHRAVKPDVFKEKIQSPKISLMIGVDKISNIIQSCNEAQIDIAVAPRHYYWGNLEVVVRDPDGTILVFTCPYDETEARKVSADESWMNKK